MKFDFQKTINGIDLLSLRDFLKRFFSHSRRDAEVRIKRIHLLERRRLMKDFTTHKKIERLAKQEKVAIGDYLDGYVPGVVDPYIKASETGGFISIADGYAKLTDLGRSLVLSRKKTYSRNAAKRQLDMLVERCRALNQTPASASDPVSLAKVTRLEVFGSFLGENNEVGDVDVYIEIGIKDEDTFRACHNKIGLLFNDHPTVVALKKLKRGLNIVSITDRKDGLDTRFETIIL